MSNIVVKGNTSGAGTTTFQSANTSSSTTFTLPGTDGTNGQAMVTDGSGNLSFTTVSTAPTAQAFVTQATGSNSPPGGYTANDSFALI